MKADDDDLVLQVYGATAEMLPGNVLEVTIGTSQGDIQGLLHPCEGETGAVLWIGGASGGMNGPAGGLYADFAHDLVRRGITSFRLRYRKPGEFQDCVLDALAGISFLKSIGATRIAVVGHSFGGAIAISAGALSPAVMAVAALSSQSAGTHMVQDLSPRPLLLVHGLEDQVVPQSSAEDIYRRAGEPRQLVLYPETGHGLAESRGALEELLRAWLVDRVGNPSLVVASAPSMAKTLSRPILVQRGEEMVLREISLFQGDITEVRADAIVCPTNDELWMGEGVARQIVAKGGASIYYEAEQHAPAEIGVAIALRGGRLKAKYVIAAIIGASAWSYHPPDEQSIRKATRNCLKQAEELQLKSLAFPALGTGSGGVAFENVAHIMVEEVVGCLKESVSVEKAIFALFNANAFRTFEAELEQYD